jgi:hypothetical protein
VDFASPDAMLYGTPPLLLMGAYFAGQWRTNRQARARLATAIISGMHEPASLHPDIDANKCLGCCACPEGNILGLINRKAALVSPSDCMGDGACRVKEIKPDAVVIEHDSTIQTLPNDFVVVCVGGLLPTPFLHSTGIQVEAKFGTA